MTDRLGQKNRGRSIACPKFEVVYLAIEVRKNEVSREIYISNSYMIMAFKCTVIEMKNTTF